MNIKHIHFNDILISFIKSKIFSSRSEKCRPIPAAWCKAVAPKLLAIVGSAPWSIRYLAVAVCP